MTVRELLAILFRRWYLMTLGATIALAAVFVSTHQPGVHWTRFEVVFLPPVERVANPNSLERGPYDLTSMAGAVVTEYNAGRHPQQMSTAGTTLYGEGMRSGAAVRLHNSGSQWMQVHDRPVIDVQVVDEDPRRVARQAREIFEQLSAILLERQRDIGVRERSMMTAISSPAEPAVAHIGGSRSRAALATGLLGALVTTLLVVWVDRWLAARRAARQGHDVNVQRRHGPTPSPR